MNASALQSIALQKQSTVKPKTMTGALVALGLSIAVFVILPAINGTNVIKAWKESQ